QDKLLYSLSHASPPLCRTNPGHPGVCSNSLYASLLPPECDAEVIRMGSRNGSGWLLETGQRRTGFHEIFLAEEVQEHHGHGENGGCRHKQLPLSPVILKESLQTHCNGPFGIIVQID